MKKFLSILLFVSVVANVALVLVLRESRYEVQQTTKAAQDANDAEDFLMTQHKKMLSQIQPTSEPLNVTTNQYGGDLSVQRISEFIQSANRLSHTLNATVSVSYPLKGELRKVDFTPNGAVLK